MCVHNYHIKNKELPTVEKLQKKLKDDINFNGSKRSLRRILNNLGLSTGRWKKAENNRRLLIEKTNTRLLRIEYPEKLIKYRQEGRLIIYTQMSHMLIHLIQVLKRGQMGHLWGSKNQYQKGKG